MNQQIFSHRQRLDRLFNRVTSFTDPYEQAEWSKYLCILVSGYIEKALRVLLEEYAYNHSSPYIQNFVSKEIGTITNCKTNKIKDILSKFNPSWGTDFITEINHKSQITNEIKNSIDSIVANRHKIAHGENTGISYSTVENYYKNVKKAIDILESIIK